jgi:hypothetical protein
VAAALQHGLALGMRWSPDITCNGAMRHDDLTTPQKRGLVFWQTPE